MTPSKKSAHAKNDAEPAGPEEEFLLSEVFALAYDDLKKRARYKRRALPSVTLNTTAVVNEIWIKLQSSPRLASITRRHLMSVAAKAMEQVLMDAAKRRRTQKRGAGAQFVTASEIAGRNAFGIAEFLMLGELVGKLEKLDSVQADVVRCRLFGAMNVADTAKALDLSESTVGRKYRFADAWIKVSLGQANDTKKATEA